MRHESSDGFTSLVNARSDALPDQAVDHGNGPAVINGPSPGSPTAKNTRGAGESWIACPVGKSVKLPRLTDAKACNIGRRAGVQCCILPFGSLAANKPPSIRSA